MATAERLLFVMGALICLLALIGVLLFVGSLFGASKQFQPQAKQRPDGRTQTNANPKTNLSIASLRSGLAAPLEAASFTAIRTVRSGTPIRLGNIGMTPPPGMVTDANPEEPL